MKHLLFFLLSAVAISANAKIHMESNLCEESGQICFYWWPVLPTVPGWRQDGNSSYEMSANAQVPIGSTFANAETVIYAKAIYKPAQPESKDLESFIQNDQAASRAADRSVRIDALPPIRTLEGKSLRRYSFTPGANGNWEQVAYGEENDENGNEYFLTFVISSRTQNGLAKNLEAFERYISNYR